MQRFLAARVSKIDARGFSLQLRCLVHNPNPLGAEIHDLKFRTTIGRFELGRGAHAGRVRRVEAHSDFLLEVPVRVDFSRLPPDLPERAARGTVLMRTEAWFTARTSLGSYPMSLVSHDSTAIDKALQVAIRASFSGEAFSIQRIDFRSLQLRQVQLSLTARVKNLFPFAVHIQRARYELFINDRKFGQGTLSQALQLPPGQQRLVPFPVAATHGAVIQAVGALATTDPRFRVRGTVWLGRPIAGISQLPLDIRADSSVFSADQ